MLHTNSRTGLQPLPKSKLADGAGCISPIRFWQQQGSRLKGSSAGEPVVQGTVLCIPALRASRCGIMVVVVTITGPSAKSSVAAEALYDDNADRTQARTVVCERAHGSARPPREGERHEDGGGRDGPSATQEPEVLPLLCHFPCMAGRPKSCSAGSTWTRTGRALSRSPSLSLVRSRKRAVQAKPGPRSTRSAAAVRVVTSGQHIIYCGGVYN